MAESLLQVVHASLAEVAGGFERDLMGREAAIGQLDELLANLQRGPEPLWAELQLLDLLLEWPHTRRAFLRFLPAYSGRGDADHGQPPLPTLRELFETISAVKNVLVRARPQTFDDQVVAWLQPQPPAAEQPQRSES